MGRHLVTFIVPTIGRETLATRAVPSLIAQSDPDWTAVLVGDGLSPYGLVRNERNIIPEEFADPRVSSLSGPPQGSGGMTRNVGIEYELGTHPDGSDWLAFLDDDDALTPEYVRELRRAAEAHDVDVVVQRMSHPELGVLPHPYHPKIAWGQVGISFAVKRSWFRDKGLRFVAEHDKLDPHNAVNSDWKLLETLVAQNASFQITPDVTYLVRRNA